MVGSSVVAAVVVDGVVVGSAVVVASVADVVAAGGRQRGGEQGGEEQERTGVTGKNAHDKPTFVAARARPRRGHASRACPRAAPAARRWRHDTHAGALAERFLAMPP
ncbi:hypothetical protein [Nannocystis punicea]|uniref:Secreted protein n=1 Tax=Nannocystis punicea TaxID=2995304 RepID=A0ABY7GT41_9BACT|nr:hypothetical protein [Nannocystis poenicansa]WAS90039.1 hypothetical protein O0S08_27920 [Nannocystis poenicansa]